MFKLILANRYAALVWVGLSLFGAAAFVSEGGGIDRLSETAQRLRGQQDAMASPSPSDMASSEFEAAEEEPPALEPSESATPQPGDVIIGSDGRRYRVVGTTTENSPQLEQPAE